MMSLKKCIAISAGCLVLVSMSGWAGQKAGNVTNLSGPLLAKKDDGTVKILAQKSEVEQGDTLISEKNTYARIKFIDNSEMTLRPNSQIKINSFSFDEAKPEGDSAVFNLIKGGLRAVTGLLGKRNKERVSVNTPTATIGIRGTIFIAEYIPPESDSVAVATYAHTAEATSSSDKLQTFLMKQGDEYASLNDAAPLMRLAQAPASFGLPSAVPSAGARAPGLYVQVLDGMIHLSNQGGTQSFTSGQFGYTATLVQPPVVLPANPGIQFTPPPAFSVSSSSPGATANKQSASVSCEVR
ncbi:MAG: FecR family protein [Pseudomonadota bacterium]